MGQKQPMVFIEGNEALTNSNFFQALINIASEMKVRIDFNYEGLEEDHNTYWGEEPFAQKFVQTWESKFLKGKRIELYDMFGIKKTPEEISAQKGNILTMDDLITHVESVHLFKGNTYVASVDREKNNQGTVLYASKGIAYDGQFGGLKPELGKINDPRPWLERIVVSYFGR